MSDDELFGRDEIEHLLGALDSELTRSGTPAAVYVVGGAAIVLRDVAQSRRTGDVDALMVPEAELLEAAHVVAEEHGVRPDWLNAAARPFIPEPRPPLEPPADPGLSVRTAPDEDLLAMKIIAARGERDMRDIVPLANRLTLSTADELAAVVIAAYGEDKIESVHGGIEDLLLYCGAVERVLKDRSEAPSASEDVPDHRRRTRSRDRQRGDRGERGRE